MSKNQEYAERYANFAMVQMRKYGIPASVTLAQGILESSNGQSRLAQKENNHFGIKATAAWIEGGGKYGLYTDDKPDEKFCSYATVGDSLTTTRAGRKVWNVPGMPPEGTMPPTCNGLSR